MAAKARLLVAWAMLLSGACLPLRAQKPAFDVVSVKASGTNRVVLTAGQSVAVRLRSVSFTGERVTCNIDLRTIIREAYSVAEFQVVAPDWAATNTYEVTAVAPTGTSKPNARLMLQTMLEDRFGLRSHRETRELTVYALTIAKSGFKGVPAAERPGSTRGSGAGLLTASAITLDELATTLSHRSNVPVLNQTGVAGRYEVNLHWNVDEAEAHASGSVEGGLALALQDQLGLKLERRRGQFEMFVVDRVEKTPSAN